MLIFSRRVQLEGLVKSLVSGTIAEGATASIMQSFSYETKLNGARITPGLCADVRQVLELKEDVGVADEQGALHHGPEDARVPRHGVVVRVQGQKVTLGCPGVEKDIGKL